MKVNCMNNFKDDFTKCVRREKEYNISKDMICNIKDCVIHKTDIEYYEQIKQAILNKRLNRQLKRNLHINNIIEKKKIKI